MIELSTEQALVVHMTGGSHVVRAGAGTGKTETLTRRVLHLLLEELDGTRADLHQVIALTFTNKAAGEMRQRVYQSILRLLMETEDEALRARLETLRAGFADHNRIGTFDSFNQRLLTLYPEQALVPAAFETMSPYDERDLQARLTHAFWEHAESWDGGQRQDLFDLLALFDRRRLPHLIARLAEEDAAVLQKLARPVAPAEWEPVWRACAADAMRRLERRTVRRMEAQWQRYLAALPADLPRDLAGILSDRQQMAFASAGVLTKSHGFYKKFMRPEWATPCAAVEQVALPLLKTWREMDKRRQEALEKLDLDNTPDWREIALASQNVVQKLARFAVWWQAERARVCYENRWADFAALHRAALHLVRDPRVRERLQHQTRHILIDEFQDTSLPQWQLIDALRADNVLIVGDEKQAIYRFRGGDITVFNEVRAELIGATPPLPLSVSRRSTRPIVEFCNRLFRELLPDDLEREDFEAPFQALQWFEAPAGAGDEPGVSLLAAPAGDCDDRADDEVQLLARATARLLREIQDDAAAPDGETLRQPEFKPISDLMRGGATGASAVLFRTHARKALYETALQAAGVQYTSVQGIGFFQSETVRDAINLTRFFFDAEDSLALTGILRSPLIGLSDRALLELHTHDPRHALWQTVENLCDAAAGRRLEAVCSDAADRLMLWQGQRRLNRWRNEARLQPLSAVLELLWRESELAYSEGLAADAAQRRANRDKLLEIIRDRETRGYGALRELAEFLTAQEAEEDREADATLPEGGAIQLMTVYAAKGLGFPMVVVAQTDDTPSGDTETIKRGAFPTRDDIHYCVKVTAAEGDEREPVLWTIMKEEERAHQDAEFRRLLYVACTRAKGRLVLVQPAKPRSGSWGAMLAPFIADIHPLRTGDLLRQAATTSVAVAPQAMPPLDLALVAPLTAAKRNEASVTWALRNGPVIPPPLPDAQSDEVADEVMVASAPGIDDGPQHRDIDGREWGTAVHRLLEIHGHDADLSRVATGLARTHHLPPAAAPLMLRQVQVALQWLQAQGFDLQRARREVPFSVPGVELQHVSAKLADYEWVNGTIDLLVPSPARAATSGTPQLSLVDLAPADAAADGWVIIDYKTHDRHHSVADMLRQFSYEDQLRSYAAAAAYLGVHVVAAWLLFLDDDGKVRGHAVPLNRKEKRR